MNQVRKVVRETDADLFILGFGKEVRARDGWSEGYRDTISGCVSGRTGRSSSAKQGKHVYYRSRTAFCSRSNIRPPGVQLLLKMLARCSTPKSFSPLADFVDQVLILLGPMNAT